jgi:hypothetical protein
VALGAEDASFLQNKGPFGRGRTVRGQSPSGRKERRGPEERDEKVIRHVADASRARLDGG